MIFFTICQMISTLRDPPDLAHRECSRLAAEWNVSSKNRHASILGGKAVKTGTPKPQQLGKQECLVQTFQRIAKSFYLRPHRISSPVWFDGKLRRQDRGFIQGTVAIQRAEVNLDDLVLPFLSAVGLIASIFIGFSQNE